MLKKLAKLNGFWRVILCATLIILLCLPQILLAGLADGTNCGLVSVAPVDDPAGSLRVVIDTRAFAFKATAPAGATRITEIGWWCDTASEESNFEVALYEHDAGTDLPTNRLFVDATNAKGTDAGWKSVAVDWNIVAETIYWLAVQLDDTGTATNTDYTSSSGYRWAFKTSQTSLPDPWENTGVYDDLVAIYGVYEVEAPAAEAATGAQVIIVVM